MLVYCDANVVHLRLYYDGHREKIRRPNVYQRHIKKQVIFTRSAPMTATVTSKIQKTRGGCSKSFEVADGTCLRGGVYKNHGEENYRADGTCMLEDDLSIYKGGCLPARFLLEGILIAMKMLSCGTFTGPCQRGLHHGICVAFLVAFLVDC